MGVITARTAAIVELHDKHEAEWRKMSQYHEWRYDNLRAEHLMYANRLRSSRELAADRKEDQAKLRERHGAERAELKARFHVESWSGFVASEAGHGNRAALDIIERKMRAEAIELQRLNVTSERSPDVSATPAMMAALAAKRQYLV